MRLMTALMALTVVRIASAEPSERKFDSLKPVSQEPALYTPGEVNKPVLALVPKVAACGGMKEQGVPMLELAIAADGTVSKALVTGAPAALVTCVEKVMKTATFPARAKSKGTAAKFAIVYLPLQP